MCRCNGGLLLTDCSREAVSVRACEERQILQAIALELQTDAGQRFVESESVAGIDQRFASALKSSHGSGPGWTVCQRTKPWTP